MFDLEPSPRARDLSGVSPGAVVRLAGPGPFILRGVRGTQQTPIIFEGAEPLTVGAPRARGQRLDGEALHFLDGCEWFGVRGVRVDGSRGGVWHGLRFRGCSDFTVRDCVVERANIEGYIWGNCRRVTVERCVARESGQSGRYPGNFCHGFYPGFMGGPYAFLDCLAESNRGLGWHVNGTADEAPRPLTGLTLRQCIARGNGSGGSGNVDLNWCTRILIEDSLIAAGNGGLATWDDGAGNPSKGAKQVTVRRSTITSGARFGVRLEQGGEVEFDACLLPLTVTRDESSRATYTGGTLRGVEAAEALNGDLSSRMPGLGWRPIAAPPPPPAALAERLAALEGQLRGLAARAGALEGR